MQNRSFILVARPDGMVRESDFALREEPMPVVTDGTFLIRNHFASIDPAMRGWLDDRPSYLSPVGIGEAMRAGTVGQVVESRADGFAPGDWVKGMNALQDYSLGDPGDGNQPIDPSRVSSMSHYISVVGGAALTAYVGVHNVLRPKAGETMLISSAAGGVGSVAGQLAKLAGVRVIGLAGGPEKCRRLTNEYGLDHAIDHRGKDEAAISAELAAAAPEGLDMLFENVGGPGLDAALMQLNHHARVALCGLISEYNGPAVGARNLKELIFRSATMQGFTLLDYLGAIPAANAHLLDLANSGRIICPEQIEEGLENAYTALRKLFVGGTDGKLILRIA